MKPQKGKKEMGITTCPTCGGQKTVSKPPWVAGDQETWSSGSAGDLYPCQTCDGKGYVIIKEEGYLATEEGKC